MMKTKRHTSVKNKLLRIFGLEGRSNRQVGEDALKLIVNGLSDRLLIKAMESLSKEKQYEFLFVVNGGATPERSLEWIKQNVPEFFEWLHQETNDVRDKIVD